MTVMTLVSDCYKITKSVFEISALSDIYFLTSKVDVVIYKNSMEINIQISVFKKITRYTL